MQFIFSDIYVWYNLTHSFAPVSDMYEQLYVHCYNRAHWLKWQCIQSNSNKYILIYELSRIPIIRIKPTVSKNIICT